MLEFPKKSFVASLIFLLLATLAIFLIAKVILGIGKFSGFSIKIIASSAEGLGIGSAAVLSGVQIGKVSQIQLSEDGMRAIITVDIKRGVKISKDAKVEFRMKGVLGDRLIAFKQGQSSEYLKDGDVIIIGEDEGGIGRISEGAAEVLMKFSEIADSLKTFIDNVNSFVVEMKEEKVADSIGSSARNLNSTIMEINSFVKDLRRILHDIENTIGKVTPSVDEFSEDITEISRNAKDVSFRLKNLLENMEKDGILSIVGEDKEKIRRTIEGFEKIPQKVDISLSRANNILVKAEEVIESAGSIGVGMRVEGGILGGNATASSTLFASLVRDKTFFEFGIVSPPGTESLKFNSILGISPLSSFDLGGGFIRSQPSFLFEFRPFDFLFVRGESLGFSKPNLRGLIGGRYKFLRFYGGAENIMNQQKFLFLGIEAKK